jgi:spore coat protein U-like protein
MNHLRTKLFTHVRCAFLLAGLVGSEFALAAIECRVNVNPVAFGSYDPLSTSNLENSSGFVEVLCRSTTTLAGATSVGYSIALSSGLSGSFNPRTLREVTRGSATLQYNLFSNPGRTMVWGDGTSPSNPVPGTIILTTANAYVSGNPMTIYGALFARQLNKPGGAYSDNLQVTVSY